MIFTALSIGFFVYWRLNSRRFDQKGVNIHSLMIKKYNLKRQFQNVQFRSLRLSVRVQVEDPGL